MNLEKVLPPNCVLLDLGIADKARVMSGLAKLLASRAGLPPAMIESALTGREALGSTGVGGGVALPHARLHALTEVHGVFVRLSSPIDFESIDGKPVDLVCAIVAPDEPNAALLSAVAAISRVLRDDAKKATLRRTHDAGEARRALTAPAG